MSHICIVDDGTSRINALMVDPVPVYPTSFSEYNLFKPYPKVLVCDKKRAKKKTTTNNRKHYTRPNRNVSIV